MELAADDGAPIQGELNASTASTPQHMSTPTSEKIARAQTLTRRTVLLLVRRQSQAQTYTRSDTEK